MYLPVNIIILLGEGSNWTFWQISQASNHGFSCFKCQLVDSHYGFDNPSTLTHN